MSISIAHINTPINLLFSTNQCCSFDSMHPPSPINLGEAWTKSIYEAVRNSPQWKNTLFLITFDEHGVCITPQYSLVWLFINPPQGFADHVPPPVGVPNPDGLTYTETAADGTNYTFDFNRLGVRCVFFRRHLVFLHAYRVYLSVPTLVISPWVQKGAIEHAGINNGRTYTHSSIASFIAKASFSICWWYVYCSQNYHYSGQLWNLDNGVPLTTRVAFASSFEHLITNTFRDDTPVTLPNPANDWV